MQETYFCDEQHKYRIKKHSTFTEKGIFKYQQRSDLISISNFLDQEKINTLTPKILNLLKSYNALEISGLIETVTGFELIPPNITEMQITHCYNLQQQFVNLPLNLKSFAVYLLDYQHPFDILPQPLETFKLSILKRYTIPMLNLPLGLKNLYVSLANPDDYEYSIVFPPNLEKVQIDANVDLNLLPDTVKFLAIERSNKLPLYKLPRNVEEICINSNDEEQIANILSLIDKLEKEQQLKIKILKINFNVPFEMF